MSIASYRDIYAELGFYEVGLVYDETNIPDGFRAFAIYHAWCARRGYYDYADSDDYVEFDGVTESWYDKLDYYRNGGYDAF